ncbi:MAG: zf-HC2 domain-containing protein, partial [Candidatus Limnocylindrales bacterium]
MTAHDSGATHEPYLELAAAAVDFELSVDERSALEKHLAGCGSCRHRSAMFGADVQAIGAQPPWTLSAAGYDRIDARLRDRDRVSLGTLRLVALAAILALVAVGAVQVGAQVIQRLEREQSRPLVEAALPVMPSPGRPAPSTPSPSSGPAAGPGGIPAGTIVDV